MIGVKKLDEKFFQFFQKYNNHTNYFCSANFTELAGGKNKKCDILKMNGSQYYEHYHPTDGKDMVKQVYDLKKEFVCYPEFDPTQAYG